MFSRPVIRTLSALAMALFLAAPAVALRGDVPTDEKSARIEKLIRQMGADRYFERKQAQDELQKIGPVAFDALVRACGNKDIEIAARAKFLVRSISIAWIQEDDNAQVKNLLKGYGNASSEERTETLQELANLPNEAGLAAVCRAVRFDRSERVAKHAALLVMNLGEPLNAAQSQRRRRTIGQSLGPSQRPAANWIRAAVAASQGQLAAAADDLLRLGKKEIDVLKNSPWESSVEIVTGLLKIQTPWLSKLGRREEALTSIRRVVELDPGTEESLPNLVDWLVDIKAWEALTDLENLHRAMFESEPLLMYALAGARLAQGDKQAAERTAKRALEANPGSTRDHLLVAYTLRNRGQLEWAELEFRACMSAPPKGAYFNMLAHFWLAEMLHDQERDLDAAKTLEAAVALMDHNIKSNQVDQNGGRDINAIRARMHFFFGAACDDKNDRDKKIEHLEKAVTADPTDADALIALYRLPDPSPERKAKTRKQIREAVEIFRQQIKADADDASPHNQLAWLVSNTEGDYQEALRSSQRSLELKPNTSAYLDTLGRCCYAVGDLENAIVNQRQAVKLEPHSRQLQRQLKFFEQLAKKEQATKND